MNYDVIIIGAGLGGLTAAAKLAKEGKKVLVLEQHTVPGGCATTFRRGPFTMEVGLHEMDGPGERDMKMRVFNDLGITGSIEFLRVPEFYRFINDRYQVTISHDPDATKETLKTLFPGEAGGIDLYFEHITSMGRGRQSPNVRNLSLGDYLDSIIRNEDLKLILLGNLGYFNDDPYTLSLAYYAVAQGSYYNNGASYIRGGSQVLSDYLSQYISSKGGKVLKGSLVTGLVTEGRKITAAKWKNLRTNELFDESATEFVAGCALPNIAGFLDPEAGSALMNDIAGQKPGASLLTIYLGFNRPMEEFGNKHYSTFVYGDNVLSQKDIALNNKDSFDRRSFAFVDYNIIDTSLAPEGKGTGSICCIDYHSTWADLSRKDYLEKKERTIEMFTSRLANMFPGAEKNIGYSEAGTPLTVKRYTLNPEGAVYGFAQTPLRKPVDSISALINLSIASAWGKTGGGFSGAIMGGYLCALNLIRKMR